MNNIIMIILACIYLIAASICLALIFPKKKQLIPPLEEQPPHKQTYLEYAQERKKVMEMVQ